MRLQEGASLWLADLNTGRLEELWSISLPARQGRIQSLLWSPAGDRLAFACCFRERDPYEGTSGVLLGLVTAWTK